MLVEADHAGMTAVADLASAGQLRPVIAGTFPLAEAAKAHAVGETRHVAGKLALTVP
jgi:NADPH:quinone reductase-like Zn-dependent oxidoreductase